MIEIHFAPKAGNKSLAGFSEKIDVNYTQKKSDKKVLPERMQIIY
jgi:hypothetical protein